MQVFKYEIPQNVKDVADINKKNFLETTNRMSKEVHPKKSLYTKYIKRLIDIVVSIAVLIITLPVNLIIGVITFFDVGSPIFFAQNRTGKDGKICKCSILERISSGGISCQIAKASAVECAR